MLTDTFQLGEADEGGGQWDVFPINNERATKQKALDIRVIFGNPPYSSGQESANDNNANLKYGRLDTSIADSYAKRSTATNKNSLYDSYVRAIRWASDRLLGSPQGGVVAFVTNGGYIDSNTADGLRLTLGDEFHHLYVFNLRGNQRTAGEVSRKEGGKIFDAGSRATVAIMLLVKEPGAVPATGGSPPLPRHRRLPHTPGEARHPGRDDSGHARHSADSRRSRVDCHRAERTRRLDQPAVGLVRVAPAFA